MTELPERVEAVRIAAEHGRVGLLTNNGPLAGRWIGRWCRRCRRSSASTWTRRATSGHGSPSPRSSSGRSRTHGVPADRTFFADDMPVNVEAARSVGIHAVLVEEHTDLRDAVRAFVAVTDDSLEARVGSA